MSTPVLTFFNNKGGVGKTSLVVHLSWMFAEMGKRVVAIDLDPQANLTSAFLPDETLEHLWDVPLARAQRAGGGGGAEGSTVFRCLEPLIKVGDIRPPVLQHIAPNLVLVAGDLALSSFEDRLSEAWNQAMDSDPNNLYRPFRVLTGFWQVAQMAAQAHEADLILADVGPNLGAINRSALIASDHVVIPLAADLFSLQGLRNLGPTLERWRRDWQRRKNNWETPDFDLPSGAMRPEGYVLMQHMERLSRPVKAFKKWSDRIPQTYQECVSLDNTSVDVDVHAEPHCLARLRHYRSLAPMAQEARKPIFHLTSADGAIGNHAQAVNDAWREFRSLTEGIAARIWTAPS